MTTEVPKAGGAEASPISVTWKERSLAGCVLVGAFALLLVGQMWSAAFPSLGSVQVLLLVALTAGSIASTVIALVALFVARRALAVNRGELAALEVTQHRLASQIGGGSRPYLRHVVLRRRPQRRRGNRRRSVWPYIERASWVVTGLGLPITMAALLFAWWQVEPIRRDLARRSDFDVAFVVLDNQELDGRNKRTMFVWIGPSESDPEWSDPIDIRLRIGAYGDKPSQQVLINHFLSESIYLASFEPPPQSNNISVQNPIVKDDEPRTAVIMPFMSPNVNTFWDLNMQFPMTERRYFLKVAFAALDGDFDEKEMFLETRLFTPKRDLQPVVRDRWWAE